MGLNGGIDLTGLINTDGLEKKLDPVVDKLDTLIDRIDKLTGKKAKIEFDSSGVKDINLINESLEKLDKKIKAPKQKMAYFQSIENATIDMKKSWNDFVKSFNNGDISSDNLYDNKAATRVLRYANAFEALGGNISNVSPEISEFINKMRSIDKYTQNQGYNFTVTGFKEAFAEFDKLRQAGISFNAFDSVKNDVSQLLSLSTEAASSVGNLGTQIGSSFGSNSGSMDGAISEQREYQAELERTRQEILLTEEQMKKQLQSSYSPKGYVDEWDITYGIGINADNLSDIEKYSQSLDILKKNQQEALKSATYWQNRIAELKNKGIKPDHDYNSWMQSDINDYHKYIEQISYVQEKLQVALKSYTPNAEGNNAQAINALVLLLQNLNEQIEKIRIAFGTIDDNSDVPNLLSSIQELKQGIIDTVTEIKNISQAISGIKFNVNISTGSGKNPIQQMSEYGDSARATAKLLKEAFSEIKNITGFRVDNHGMKYLAHDAKDLIYELNRISELENIALTGKFEGKNNLKQQNIALQELIDLYKKAAAYANIDLSSWTEKYTNNIKQSVDSTQKMLSGEKQAEDATKQLTSLFGNANNITLSGLTAEIDKVIAKLQEMIELLRTGLDVNKINLSSNGQNSLNTEVLDIEALKNKILEVKNAILLKNNAFSQEEKIVSSTVKSEVNQLQLLHTNLKVILETLKQIQEIPIKLNISGFEDGNNKESVLKSIENLKNSLNGLDPNLLKELNNILKGLSIEESIATNIQKLANAILNLKSNLNNVSPSSTEFLNSIKELVYQAGNLKDLATVIRASKEEIEKVKATIATSGSGASSQATSQATDKEKYAILKDTLREILSLTKEYNKEKDAETKSNIGAQIQLYKDRADTLQLELWDLAKINEVEQNRIDIIQARIKAEEQKQENKELAYIQRQIDASEALENKLNEQYTILAKDSNEWKHALELLSLYKNELKDIVKITRNINVDKNTGFKAISYQFTDSEGSTKTVGADSKLLMENTKVADLNKLYAQLKSSANEYYSLQTKIINGDTSSKTQTESLISYNNMVQAQKDIAYWKEKGLVPSREQLQIEEKIAGISQALKEKEQATGLQNMYTTVLNTIERLNAKQKEVNELKLKADGTQEFAESIKNAQEHVSILIGTLRGFKFEDFFTQDALSSLGLNGSSLLFNNDDLNSLKWVISQLPLTEEQIQKINDALDKNTLIKEKNTAAQNKLNSEEQKKLNSERISQANENYKMIEDSLIKQYNLTKEISQLEKSGNNEKAKIRNKELVEEFHNCEALIAGYRTFSDVIADVDANLNKVFSDSRNRFGVLESERKDAQQQSQKKEQEKVIVQVKKESDAIDKKQKSAYSQFEQEQIKAQADAYRELNSLIDQYISKRNSAEKAKNPVDKAVLSDDATVLLDKIELKLDTLRSSGLLTESQIKEALDRLNVAEDELTRRLEVRRKAQEELTQSKTQADTYRELNSLIDQYIKKKEKAENTKNAVDKTILNKDALTLYDELQNKINSVKESGILTETQISQLLETLSQKESEIIAKLEERRKAQTDLSTEGAYKGLISTELEYQKLKGKVDSGVATDKEIQRLNELTTQREAYNKKLEETTVLTKQESDLKGQYQTIVGESSKIIGSLNQTQVLMDQVFNRKKNIPGFKDAFDRAQAEVDELNKKLEAGKISNIQTGYTDKVNKIIADLNNVVAVTNPFDKTSAQNTMETFLKSLNGGNVTIKDFTNNGKTLTATFEEQKGVLREVAVVWDETSGKISLVDKGTKRAQSTLTAFMDGIKARFRSLLQYLSIFVSYYRIIGMIKNGIQVVRDLDTALTEMRKVSDETVSSLKNFQDVSFDIAKSVGTTAKQIQNSTADFMRLGESLEEAAKSAEVANILLNVSEFENIDDATSSLVAMSAAYDELDKIEIVDKLNLIGNNFAISTDGLASALQKSASALTTAGNDIDEAIALATAANQVVQDPDSVGAGIRTVALRITGTESAKEELKELGEDVEDFVVTTSSKLNDEVKKLTKTVGKDGISLLDDNGNYRSTYEILQDIADVWEKIAEEDLKTGQNRQNALLEMLAGKNRSNILASILESPEVLREAYESSLYDSEGSSEKELNAYLESIEGRIQLFTNEVQEFWHNLISSDVIKGFVNAGTTIVHILGEIVDKLKIGGTVAASFVAAFAFKHASIKSGGRAKRLPLK